jgi:aminobenzoyl-glutamate transport protein
MDEKKKSLHPVWFYIILCFGTIVGSFLLSLLNFHGTAYNVSSSLKTSTSVVDVNNLISGTGIRYMFSNATSNFITFLPLGSLLIGLIGVGVASKSRLLDSLFDKLAKKVPRTVAFFLFSLLCIIMGFSTDMAFVIMIPVSVVLFTSYRRNQLYGMAFAFASVAAGSNINLFITSLDYSIIELAKNAVLEVNKGYTYGYTGNLYFIAFSSLLLAAALSILTEFITRKKPVRINEDEEEIDAKLDKIALRRVAIVFLAMVLLFTYEIIPGLPLSGVLLDNTQMFYVNKLFGANSPFVNGILYIVVLALVICGIIYAASTKQIQNNKSVIKLFTNSLNGIGEILILIFFASQFIALFKYSNIGTVVTSILFGWIRSMNLSLALLILVSVLFIMIANLFLTSVANKWQSFAPATISLFMKSNITPEFAGAIYRLTSSATNMMTPLFPYFSVFMGYVGLYNKNDFTVRKCYKVIMPYFMTVFVLVLAIVFGWYLLNIPIGPHTLPNI